MGYSGSCATGRICYGHSNARAGYGYSRGLSGKVGYSLSMPKSYGTDVNLDSYLMRGRQGIAGYVDSLIKSSLASLRTEYSYPAQKKEELYKNQEIMAGNELIMINTGREKLGVMIPSVPVYDLSSMRRPSIKLEARLN